MSEAADGRYPEVQEPMRVDEAFFAKDGAAYQVQAAAILTLGRWMRRVPRDQIRLFEDEWPQSDVEELEPVAPDSDLEELGIPPMEAQLAGYRDTTYGIGGLKKVLGEGEFEGLSDSMEAPEAERLAEIQAGLWQRIVSDPSGPDVAGLTYVSLYHHDPLVRVAAAAASVDSLTPQAMKDGHVFKILNDGLKDSSVEVATLAAEGFVRVAPWSRELRELTRPTGEGGPSVEAHTSLMVHGTFARRYPWWQPGGDFHTYIHDDVDSSLYAGGDRFEWSGGWSDEARTLGSIDLIGWIAAQELQGLDLFTHSHGGNIAMLTTRGGLDLGRIVLLSCPVHQRYLADFSHVAKAVSVRTKMDLVILLDGGGQRFHSPFIEENRLPIWFKHSVTHDPATWVQHAVPAMI